MNELAWIKLKTNMFEDEKLLIVDSMPDRDSVLIIWVKLMCQAGKCNAGGWIWLEEGMPYTDEMLTAIFHRPLNTVRMALEIYQRLGMIEINERGIFIPGFSFHNDTEVLEKIREQTRQRVERFRQRRGNATPLQSNVTVTQQNKKENKNKELEQEDTLQGAGAPLLLTSLGNCFSFEDYRNLMEAYPDKVAFLVDAFKRLHSEATEEDFQKCGGRIAGMWGKKGHDTGFILKVIWDTSSVHPAGSHLDYIHKILFGNGKNSNTAGQKKGVLTDEERRTLTSQEQYSLIQERTRDPNKFTRGKYGHMVQR